MFKLRDANILEMEEKEVERLALDIDTLSKKVKELRDILFHFWEAQRRGGDYAKNYLEHAKRNYMDLRIKDEIEEILNALRRMSKESKQILIEELQREN